MRKVGFYAVRGGALLLGGTILSTSGTALAQQSGINDDRDIVVTASKREENLQDVPMAITAIGTERLDELQVKEFQDVVKFLPSVTIQTLAPGFSQVYFRGVASGENANHSTSLPTVGTYLDEMPITTIQGALDIHAYDLARVEALAGPQGTLYGASSMAGTIKLVTNKPDTSGTYGSMGLELNSVAHGGVGGVAEGFVNVALSERAALRLVGWYRHDAGYIDNIAGTRVYPIKQNVPVVGGEPDETELVDLPGDDITQTNAGLVKKDYNEVDTYGARLALGIELDDNWTLRPTVMGQIQKAAGSFAQERSTAVTGDLQTVQYNPERSDDKWIQAALTIEGKIGNWDLTVTGGHLRRKTLTDSDYSDYAYFYDALFGSAYYLKDNAGDQISPNQYIQGIDRYKRSFGEIRVASPADARIRFIGGLFWQRQSHNIEQNYRIDNLADDLQVSGTIDNIWLTKQLRVDRDYAAFGEVSFDITDKLTLTGGGRLYKFDNSLVGFFGYSEAYSGDVFDDDDVFVRDGTGEAGCNGAPAIVSGSPCTNLDKRTKKTDFIHKLNLTYKFTDNFMAYVTWSRGFRPGGINRRGTLPPYGSDTLDNYELGWKSSFGPVRFNGAVYQEDWNNIQLSFLGANGLTEVRNAGIARIRGVEADLSYRSGGLSLSLGGAYNDATIRRDFCAIANAAFDCTTPDNELLAPAGSRLPVTSKFKGNAVARYDFPVSGLDGHVQFAVNHIGKRRSDLRPFQNDIVGNFGAYTTADFSIGVKSEDWSAELFATNLFDSRGVINSAVQCDEAVCGDADNATPNGGVFYDNVIRPRLIGIKVSKDF